jgi:hypothetical protein
MSIIETPIQVNSELGASFWEDNIVGISARYLHHHLHQTGIDNHKNEEKFIPCSEAFL